jgi:hypothetical protein
MLDHISSEILEHRDIFFFYRPKVGAREVTGVDDTRRFFMATTTDSRHPGTEMEAKTHARIKQEAQRPIQDGLACDQTITTNNTFTWYRLFTIGKKSLPEVRHTEARRSERYWAKVGGIFHGSKNLTNELLSSEWEGDSARPVGEGKYAIVSHKNRAELAYVLEMPKEPGKAQEELRIEKEASYIVSVIDPKVPVRGIRKHRAASWIPWIYTCWLRVKRELYFTLKGHTAYWLSKCTGDPDWCTRGKRCSNERNWYRHQRGRGDGTDCRYIWKTANRERKRTPVRPLVEGKFVWYNIMKYQK